MSKSELTIALLVPELLQLLQQKHSIHVPGIKVVAVADANPKSARHLADELSAIAHSDYESLLSDSRISLVYIATPPYLHYSQSKAALLAGKHVLCEKLAALRTAEAEELVSLAAAKQLLYVVDLTQRYNPLFSIVREIVNEKALGNFFTDFLKIMPAMKILNLTIGFGMKKRAAASSSNTPCIF